MWGVVCFTATFILVFDASLGAFIPELLKPSQWSGANSRLSATVSAGEVTGPAFAGFIVQVFAAPVAFLLDALSYIVSAICVALCGPSRPTDSKPVEFIQTGKIGSSFESHTSNPRGS
jgi:MFS family permease